MTEYGVGIVGMGFMGRTHAYAHRTLPYYYPGLPWTTRLVAACNRSPAAAEEARDRLGFERATTDFSDLLNDERIRLVHICTPNASHFALARAALEAKKHVYCDKPLTVTWPEARRLAALAAESGLTAQVAFQNRFFPSTLRAKELMDQGRLGEITCFRAEYLHSGQVDPDKPMKWKQGDEAGVLRDMGSHALDMMFHLLGPFASVYAETRILYPFRPDGAGGTVRVTADDHAAMLLTLPSGAAGVVEASKIATGVDDEFRFEIHGTRGALRFNLAQPNTLWFYDGDRPDGPFGGERGFTALECTGRYPAPAAFPSFKNGVGWLRGHCHSLYSFVDNVYNGRPGCPSFADGAYVQYVMERALESAASGRRLTLDPPERF